MNAAMKASRTTLKFMHWPGLWILSIWFGTTKTMNAIMTAMFQHPRLMAAGFFVFCVLAIWLCAYGYHKSMSKFDEPPESEGQ